jgi:hypothetical protein
MKRFLAIFTLALGLVSVGFNELRAGRNRLPFVNI